MAWLSQQGVPFESRDITQNDKWFDEVIELGARATPATLIRWDNRQELVMGFDQDRLKALLDL